MGILISVYVLVVHFGVIVISLLFMGLIPIIEYTMFLLTAKATPRRGVLSRIVYLSYF